MSWWFWIIIGLGLIIGELLTGGALFCLFFGLSALIVGWLTYEQVVITTTYQLLIFAGLALSLYTTSIFWLQRNVSNENGFDRDLIVGSEGEALTEIPPNKTGQISARGTSWKAKNSSVHYISSGDTVKITQIIGLTLTVIPINFTEKTQNKIVNEE
jgi:inner membrane protein